MKEDKETILNNINSKISELKNRENFDNGNIQYRILSGLLHEIEILDSEHLSLNCKYGHPYISKFKNFNLSHWETISYNIVNGFVVERYGKLFEQPEITSRVTFNSNGFAESYVQIKKMYDITTQIMFDCNGEIISCEYKKYGKNYPNINTSELSRCKYEGVSCFLLSEICLIDFFKKEVEKIDKYKSEIGAFEKELKSIKLRQEIVHWEIDKIRNKCPHYFGEDGVCQYCGSSNKKS